MQTNFQTSIRCRPCSVRRWLRTTAAAASAAPAAKQLHRSSHTPVRELSMVLLVNENLKRQIGRGLVDHSQLLTAHQLVDTADYALLVVGPSSSSISRFSATLEQKHHHEPAFPVMYANKAAVDALSCHAQQDSSSSSDGQHLQQVQLPAAITSILQTQQQQVSAVTTAAAPQHSSCSLLQDVCWQLNPGSEFTAELTVSPMLVCQVNAPNDTCLGLALLFDSWRHADGCLGVPGWPYVSPVDLPAEQQLQDAADAVRAQAEAVRQLKQGQGLANKDPAVIEAVAALQQLKQQLACLEGLQQAFQTPRQGELQQIVQAYEVHCNQPVVQQHAAQQ